MTRENQGIREKLKDISWDRQPAHGNVGVGSYQYPKTGLKIDFAP
jgi:hypothetical protein